LGVYCDCDDNGAVTALVRTVLTTSVLKIMNEVPSKWAEFGDIKRQVLVNCD